MPSVITEFARALHGAGVDVAALGLAWARATPTVALVPAFGLKALPQSARAVIALALALAIAPALAPAANASTSVPWPLLLVGEALAGLPIAIAAAVPLWAATMAGGMVDALRGAQADREVTVVEGRASVLGAPLSILASCIFLGTGGPARIAAALTSRPLGAHPIAAAARDLAGGVNVAVSIGGPLLAAAIAVEVAGALIARAATPAQLSTALAPLRALALLTVMALVLERMAGAMALGIRAAP